MITVVTDPLFYYSRKYYDTGLTFISCCEIGEDMKRPFLIFSPWLLLKLSGLASKQLWGLKELMDEEQPVIISLK